MRPFGSPKQLEKRRRKAMELLDSGLSLHAVARKINCHASSVLRWKRDRDRHGEKGLCPKPASGRPSKLSQSQKKKFIKLLLQGPMAHGYHTDLWTTARIAEFIESTFNIRYHQDHIGRLMASLSWSCQKPIRRALERDEKVIEEWKRTQWPRIKKKPCGWVPTSFLLTNRDSS